MIADVNAWIRRACVGVLPIVLIATSPAALLAQPPGLSTSPSIETAPRRTTNPIKDLMTVSDQKTSTTDAAEMAAAAKLTTKVLAIGTWTAKATPETRPPIMPAEARDTMRLMLAGKIDQWFAKIDGSGAVFLMNVTDPAEAHALLEKLPLVYSGCAMERHLGIPAPKESRAVVTELYARARFPAHGLRRYAERAEECATHAFTVSKTRFLRYLVNGVSPFLHHEPGSLQSKLFNGFCR